MIDISTGKQMTRGGFLRGILASGIAPSISLGAVALAGSANATVGGMMRNVGARNAAMFGGDNINPYGKDLVCQFDGIWNDEIWKDTDQQQTHWKDLISGSISSGIGTFENNSFNPTSYSCSMPFTDEMSLALTGNEFTLEYGGIFGQQTNSAGSQFYFYPTNANGIVLNAPFAVGGSPIPCYFRYLYNLTYIYVADSSINWNEGKLIYSFGALSFKNGKVSIYARGKSDREYKVFRNQIDITVGSPTAFNLYHSSTTRRHLYYRIHNRALSESELNANAVVDVNRFGI